MIRYALQCDRSHAFESWFRDSAAFDEQSQQGHVACPICGSANVAKSLMAPAVRTSRKAAAVPAEPRPEAAPSVPAVPVALADERSLKLRALMRAMRDHVLTTTADVGSGFAAEARKIHEGLSEDRPIRGEATAEDVRGLLDDGIEVMPLPVFPDERN